VRFHKKILQKAPAEQTDGRPDAIELVRAAVDDGHRAELREWLTEVAAAADRVVVKDPRAVWVPWLWVDTAKELGLDISFLTMLRHPTEVLGSRQTYYASGRPHMGKWEFAIWNLCGWINGNLLIEQQTRDHRRTFVRYTDLLGDWRAAMTKVRADLGIELDDDLDPGHTHEIDDFIDADLRRHEVDWSVWELPEELVEIAQATFDGLSQLSDRGGHDPETEALLDEVRDRYDALYRKSAAISQDAASARARQAAADSASAVREELKAKRAAQPKQSAPPAPPPSRFRVAGSKVLTRYPVLRRVRDRLRG
jgi:hypothetical protein